MNIKTIVVTALLFLLFVVADARATISYGVPVTGSSSNTLVPCAVSGSCLNTSTHRINFYIPFNYYSAGNVFGVTNSSGITPGTSSDSRWAPFNNTNSLTMYLKFAVAPLPITTASLSFHFVDLDLKYGNDPKGFFETVKISAGGTAISPVINALGQSSSSPYPFTVTGNYNSQTITFSNVQSLITGNKLFARLDFGVKMTEYGKWKNTLESMVPKLTYTSAVPLPSSLLFFGIGIVSMGIVRRMKR
jgi:hypothetical protein